jgi:hypothetical protein
MTDKPPTRFKALPAREGHIVADTWHEDTLIAFCPKLDAAAAFAMFLNGQESMARTCRADFLKSIGDGPADKG